MEPAACAPGQACVWGAETLADWENVLLSLRCARRVPGFGAEWKLSPRWLAARPGLWLCHWAAGSSCLERCSLRKREVSTLLLASLHLSLVAREVGLHSRKKTSLGLPASGCTLACSPAKADQLCRAFAVPPGEAAGGCPAGHHDCGTALGPSPEAGPRPSCLSVPKGSGHSEARCVTLPLARSCILSLRRHWEAT